MESRFSAAAIIALRSLPDRRCPGFVPGERKVRAPQSGMPGNARPHIAEASRPTRRRGTGPQRRVASFLGAGETRQPPSGATPNRRTTTLLAESAGRRLEPVGNGGPRGMTVIARDIARRNRTRLIGGLRLTEPRKVSLALLARYFARKFLLGRLGAALRRPSRQRRWSARYFRPITHRRKLGAALRFRRRTSAGASFASRCARRSVTRACTRICLLASRFLPRVVQLLRSRARYWPHCHAYSYCHLRGRLRLASLIISRAALRPGMPVTPPPGCAPEPHK